MKELTDEQIDTLPFNNELFLVEALREFARAVIAEFCKINGLTGEAQPAAKTCKYTLGECKRRACVGQCQAMKLAEQAKGQEVVGYLVAGWHEGRVIAHQMYFTVDEALETASAFAKHYPTVTTRPLYTTPPAQPAREWVSLTEKEVTEAFLAYAGKGSHPAMVYSAIESKLREKNAGQPAAQKEGGAA